MNDKLKSVQFPLLSTPRNVLNEILKSMDLYYLIQFSILSKKTKLLVEALNVKPMPIDIYVTNELILFADNKISICSTVLIANPVALTKRKKPGCKRKIYGKEFLEHVLIFFKQTTVRALLFFGNLGETFLPTVFYYVPYCENFYIYENVSESAQRKILSKYQNATNQLRLYSNPPEDIRKEIVMRNLDHLGIHKQWMTLESLLSANSATLGCYHIDMKILNRFLKLWIRNKSNSRLEYFYMDIWDQVEEKVQTLLAGIDYKEVPSGTIRIFKHSRKTIESNVDWLTMTNTIKVRGGYDFMRRDGTRATITVREKNLRMRLEIFVWY